MPPRWMNYRSPIGWAVVLAGYWSLLAVLTHIPITEAVAPVTSHDKTLHVVAYAVLAGLLAATMHFSGRRQSERALVVAGVVCLVYAALDEWTQGLVGRTPSVGDWLADAAGAGLGLALFAGLRRWVERGGSHR